MSDSQLHKQNPECAFTFNALMDRINKIERHNLEKQDEEINEIGKTLARFEVLIEKQNETNNIIMREFAENRRENLELHKEKDSVIQELSKNILDISHSLMNVSKTQGDIMTSISSFESNQRKAIDEQNRKIDDINQRDTISVTGLLKQYLIQAVLAVLSAGVAIQFLAKK